MRSSERRHVLLELATACQSLANRPCFHCARTQTTFLGHLNGLRTISAILRVCSNFLILYISRNRTYSMKIIIETLRLTFLINKIFFVAQDAMDTKRFGTPT